MANLKVEWLTFSENLRFEGVQYVFGPDKTPGVLLTGSIHGDEPISMAALWYLAQQLSTAPLRGKVTIVPCVNVLAASAGTRHMPHDGMDLNRTFPGRADGCMAERLAAALTNLLESHDMLIDVHSAGRAIPFVLVDHTNNVALEEKIFYWARASSLPVIREMSPQEAALQGLNRSWSAWALSQGKPAITVELSGYRLIDGKIAKFGAEVLMNLLKAASDSAKLTGNRPKTPFRLEILSNTSGFFETFLQPGDQVTVGDSIGVIRDFYGKILETVKARRDGFVIDLQPISSIYIGSWLATLAVSD